MEQSSFYKYLIIIVVLTNACYWLLCSTNDEFISYQNLFWTSQGFFILLSVASFYFGKQAVHNPNKNVFFRFMMLFIFFRLVASAAIVITYFNLYQPPSKLFLIPFFMAYLAFTIFEVFFLSKIGREN
jgi:hypothetical protein